MNGSQAISREWQQLPNLLPAGRLVAAPVVALVTVAGSRLVGVILLVLVGLADVIADREAARTGQGGRLRSLLEPVADRAVLVAATLGLLGRGELPVPLGAAVLAREFAVSAGFVALWRLEVDRPPIKPAGRTAVLALFVGALLVLAQVGPFRLLGLVVFTLGTVVSLLSAYRYGVDLRARVARARHLQD